MLAKAIATEGQFTFLSVDAASIENKWLGESEKNARALFTLARKLSPCIIFLDEVDSILSSREGGDESTRGTLTSVKTTLMQEWDGLKSGVSSPDGPPAVIVIASTNRPFDLDEAVLRRLPRRLLVDLPDASTREAIMNVTLRRNRLSADVNLTAIAVDDLAGYSGSDIKEVCREAVVRVSHELAQQIDADPSSAYLLQLRAVEPRDFAAAIDKLKASVNVNGREMQRLIEWNDKYGEIKQSNDQSIGSSRDDEHLELYI
jgi:SpoVK/Ycf46/Vps4 family AAA+-type ATPase